MLCVVEQLEVEKSIEVTIHKMVCTLLLLKKQNKSLQFKVQLFGKYAYSLSC